MVPPKGRILKPYGPMIIPATMKAVSSGILVRFIRLETTKMIITNTINVKNMLNYTPP